MVACLIVGTQVDLRITDKDNSRPQKQQTSYIQEAEGIQLAKELGATKYIECSALTQYKLKDVFDEVCDLSGRIRRFTLLIDLLGNPRRVRASQETETREILEVLCRFVV